MSGQRGEERQTDREIITDLNAAHGDPIHMIVPSGQDGRDVTEAARRFWQRRNMAPPCDVNRNFTPMKKKNK